MAKILVVDDEKNVVELLKFMLEKDGHQVEVAQDGQQALDAVRKAAPDLIVLDIMMPKVDGYTVHAELSKDEVLRKIPIIVLTAKGGMRDLFAFADNIVAYLEKPFDPKLLREKISGALTGR